MSGTVTLSGIVGGGTPLASFTATGNNITQNATVQTTGNIGYSGTTLITLNGGLTTAGGAVGMTGPVSLTALVAIGTSGGNVSFSSTVNGAESLSITGGAGTVSFSGAVGGATPLTALTASGVGVTQSSTVKAGSGGINYTGAISLGGNLTTAGGAVGMTGAVSLLSPIIFDTTNGGGTPAGAGVVFSSTINGAQTLSVSGGTGERSLLGGPLEERPV